MSPRFVLRLEGFLVFLASTAAYAATGASWWLFAAALLVPDLFMAGYLANPRIGALVYNLGHTYAVALILGAGAYFLQVSLAGALALIWAAHIGIDRALGYGLKRPTSFHDTHLSPSATDTSAPPPISSGTVVPVSTGPEKTSRD